MQYKKLAAVVIAVAMAVIATGCVKREIVAVQGQMYPDFSVKENVEIDWNQIEEDCDAILNKDDYPLGLYLDYVVDEDNKVTTLIWPLDDSADAFAAAEYAEAYMKAFNDAMAVQDFQYSLSTDKSYGGYWDTHDCNIRVFKDKDIMDPDFYMVNQVVKAGTNQPIDALELVTPEEYEAEQNKQTK